MAARQCDQGRDVRVAQYDQADEASILKLRDHIVAESGHIDVLVNNAVIHPMREGHHADAELFGKSMEVNGTGLFAITRAFGEAMAESGGGSIISMSSIYGAVGPDPTHYVGTDMSGWQPDYYFHKAGMINLTRYFAGYYGPKNVRCNCIVAGGFHTGEHPEAFMERYSARTYLGRLATCEDIKGVVVFLASDASSYVTAAAIPMDGGYTAK